MSTRPRPPFRADHVGSFLRPGACSRHASPTKGDITPRQLRTVEDGAIAEVVRFQEDLGLHGITDGEFRRTYFHIDFLEQLAASRRHPGDLSRRPRHEEFAPPVMQVIGKVRQ